ncbi:MAG TPA: glycosyltransferase family 2 protein [Polyangiales bacterium]
MTALVSIITPSYDRLDFIKGCVESVQTQTYGAIEHIVVDGGSTDGTVDFLEEMQRAGKLRYVSERDDGMYDAINKGMRMASGEVVAYLNTDDRYLPWSVELAVEQLAARKADLVFGELCVVAQRASAEARWHLQLYKKFSKRQYTFFTAIAQPTVFMKRSLVERVGEFGNGFRLIADCDYWLRAAEAGASIVHIDEVMAVQIDHAQTLRETQEEALNTEFTRLRELHGAGAGAAPGKLEARLENAVWFRYANLLYVLAGQRGDPRWRRFGAWAGLLPRAGQSLPRQVLPLLLPRARMQRANLPYGGDRLPGPLKSLLP